MVETGPAYAAVYRLMWTHCTDGPRRRVVTLTGVVNEYFDYGDLLFELSQDAATGPTEIVLDCGGITRVNSEGVSRWVRFITVLARSGFELIYRRCSPAMVTQLNQVPEVLGPARVESVLAPYRCKATSKEELRLIELAQIADLACPPRFEDEQGTWDLDEQPNKYFAFAHR